MLFQILRETGKDKTVRIVRGWIFVFLTGAMLTGNSYGQDRSQARSMVVSRNGIVAAESPLAAQAGGQALVHGGNAVGAAIATHALVGVGATAISVTRG